MVGVMVGVRHGGGRRAWPSGLPVCRAWTKPDLGPGHMVGGACRGTAWGLNITVPTVIAGQVKPMNNRRTTVEPGLGTGPAAVHWSLDEHP